MIGYVNNKMNVFSMFAERSWNSNIISTDQMS